MTATLPQRSDREELERIDTKSACGSGRHDPDLWHSVLVEDIDRAKAVCRSECGVTARCLAWALATGQEHGVWGGLSAKDRRDIGMTRRPARTADDTPSLTRYSKVARVPCGECGRPIGLDGRGRISKHMDMKDHTWCAGTLTTPGEVKA